jgi:cobalt/nickel transport system permease protein
VIQETFIAEKSLAARLDPRTRIISAVIFALVATFSYKFETLAAALFLSISFIGLSGLHLQRVAKRVAVVNIFILLFWVILPFTYKGEPILIAGPFTLSKQGVILAAKITLKSNAILLCFIALVASIPMGILGHAMSRLYVPSKMVQLLLLTYRYLFVIEQEYERLVTAAKVRCFHAKTKLHTYKTYAFISGMLFIRASEHAERVLQAMRCRGFSGKVVSLYKFSFSRIDVAWGMFMAFMILLLGMMEWMTIMQ